MKIHIICRLAGLQRKINKSMATDSCQRAFYLGFKLVEQLLVIMPVKRSKNYGSTT